MEDCELGTQQHNNASARGDGHYNTKLIIDGRNKKKGSRALPMDG